MGHSFVCQLCKQAIRIDESLSDLSQPVADSLLTPIIAEDQSKTPKNARRSQQPVQRHIEPISRLVIPPSKPSSSHSSNSPLLNRNGSNLNPAESFVMLTSSQITPAPPNPKPAEPLSPTPTTINESQAQPPNNSLSHRLKVAGRLFDIMSARSEIDHPICSECTDVLLENLGKQLKDASAERDCYIDFLKKVNTSIITEEDEEELKRETAKIRAEETRAIQSLRAIEAERDALKAELLALEAESKELDKQEESYWQDLNAYSITLQAFHNERESVNMKYDNDSKQLERLQKTNVYNDTFNIGQDGPFGTINGLRLGRLPNHPIDWSEINAAWGQTLLLLHTVANKLKFKFKTYRLVPLGSASKIEKIEGSKEVYELYGTGAPSFSMFLNRRFNHAMIAFLDCLKQLCEYAERKDPNMKLPYSIHKDKIGEASIQLSAISQDEVWTKALRHMLTNTKWILAFSSSSGVAVQDGEDPY